jgi:predicted transposase/invertase (TIGR01784 family)
MQNASEVLNVLTQEWDMGKALDTRFMEGQEDGWQRGRKSGWEEGQEYGISQGEDRANIKTARRLLGMGLKLEDVSRGSGLPIEKIKHLKPLVPDNSVYIPQ